MTWTTYDYSNKKVKIYKYYTKNNSKTKYKYTKIAITKHNNKRLAIKTIASSEKNSKASKIIKSNLSPKNYYLKIYKNKMLKNVKTKQTIDFGQDIPNNIPHGLMTWKVKRYYNGKIAISENVNNVFEDKNKKVIIEKYSKNKLKITTKSSNFIDDESKSSKNPSKNKTIKYVKTKLNPKNYYFNVYKAKMLKFISKKLVLEEGFGLLKDSETKISWTIVTNMNKKFIRNNVSIIRKYSLNESIYDSLLIEIAGTNKLKVTYKNNSAEEISYVNTKLSTVDYYYHTYSEKFWEIMDEIILVPD